MTKAVHGLLIQASTGLLPGWARELHSVRIRTQDDIVIRGITYSVLHALRLGLGSSPVLAQARKRVSTPALSEPAGPKFPGLRFTAQGSAALGFRGPRVQGA